MKQKSTYFFIGTNAEFIKLAPVIKEFKRRKVKFKIITSGQSQILFDELKDFVGPINVDLSFNVKTYRLSVFHFLIWAIRTFFVCLSSLRQEFKGLNQKNCYLIVHGDTMSSLIGAAIAKIYRLKLVHIESGLRSFNFLEPFPEEVNRFIISHLADIRFCQNKRALNNVRDLTGVNIDTKQNTLIESCWWALKRKKAINSIKKFKQYYILYIRRQEHIVFRKEWTRKIIRFVIDQSDKNLNCVFVLHPLTSKFLQLETIDFYNQLGKKLLLVSRLPYVDYMKLMNKAEYIATDGCTNQEEAYYMGLPYLGLRNLSERTEGLGKNVVISRGDKRMMRIFFKNYKKYRTRPVHIKKPPSRIIVDYLSPDRL